MPRPPKAKTAIEHCTANLGFEAKLWLAADKLRNNILGRVYEYFIS